MLETIRRLYRAHLSVAVLASILGAVSLPDTAEAVMVYTNRADWEAALAGYTIVTETFDNDVAQAESITFDSGVVSTGAPSTATARNFISFGSYQGYVDAGESDFFYDTISWTFPVAIIGFGMDLREATDGDILTIRGNFDGAGDQLINVLVALGPEDGFLGIIGTAPFTSILFSDAGAAVSVGEGFFVDGLAFAAVPEPAALALFGVGLAGLGWIARQRKQEGRGRRVSA